MLVQDEAAAAAIRRAAASVSARFLFFNTLTLLT